MNVQSDQNCLPKAPENQNSDIIMTHEDSLKIDLQKQNDELNSNQQNQSNDEANPNIQIPKINESSLIEEKTNNNLDNISFLNNSILKDNIKFENQTLVNSNDCIGTEKENINISGTEEKKDKEEADPKNKEDLDTINGIKNYTIKRLLNNSTFKLQKKKLKKERKIQEQNKKIEELLKLRSANALEEQNDLNNDMEAIEKLNNLIYSESNKNGNINNEKVLRVNFAPNQQYYYDENYKLDNQNGQDLVIDLDEQNSQTDYDMKKPSYNMNHYNNNNYPMESYPEKNNYNRFNNNEIDYNNNYNYNKEEERGNRYNKYNKINNIQNMWNRLNELISLFKNFKKETEEEEKENQRQYGRNINAGFYDSNDNNNSNDYLSDDISKYFLEEVKKKYKGKDKYKLLGIKNTYNKGKNKIGFNTQIPISSNQNNSYKINQLQLKISNLIEKYSYQIVFDSLMKYFFPSNISNNYNYSKEVINQIDQLVKDLGFGHVLSFIIKIGNSRGEVVRINKYQKSNLMDINEYEDEDDYDVNNIELNDRVNNKNEYDIIIDEENQQRDKNMKAQI